MEGAGCLDLRGWIDPEYGDAHSDQVQPGLRILESRGAVGAVIMGNGNPSIPQVGPHFIKLLHLTAVVGGIRVIRGCEVGVAAIHHKGNPLFREALDGIGECSQLTAAADAKPAQPCVNFDVQF